MHILRFTLLIIILFSNQALSQPAAIDRNKPPYRWMFGISFTGIYNSLIYIDFKGNNDPICFLPYPTRISIDKYRRKGWSREWVFSYTHGEFINYVGDSIRLQTEIYASIDYHFKYSFNQFMRNKSLDPYLVSGIGLTLKKDFETKLLPTYNFGIGINFWLTKRLAFQTEVALKLAINSNTFTKYNSDYLRLSAGFIYRKTSSAKQNQNRYRRRHTWVNRSRQKRLSRIKI